MADTGFATITGKTRGGTDLSLKLYILDGGLKHGFDKKLVVIGIPNKGEDDSKTYIIDLTRCIETVTIQGYILDTSASAGLVQKKVLIDFMRAGNGKLTLSWSEAGSDETIKGNIMKAEAKEEAGRLTDSAASLGSETKRYNVQLTFVRGTKKG